MNQLEAWRDAGVIDMNISEVAHGEACAGENAERSKKALDYFFSETLADTPSERTDLKAIEEAIFPDGARTEGERHDVEVAFNAKKYIAILVTDDGASKRQPRGLLGSRAALKRLGIDVMTDREAVAHVRKKIAERDQHMRCGAEREGTPLPPWVGAD